MKLPLLSHTCIHHQFYLNFLSVLFYHNVPPVAWINGWMDGQIDKCKVISMYPTQFSWRRKWQHTPVFLPGESHGRRSFVGYSPQVEKSRTRLSDFTSLSLYQPGRHMLWLLSAGLFIRHGF